MKLKSKLSKPYAKFLCNKIDRWKQNPIETQDRVFKYLINKAKDTAFGQDHNFASISSYEDFKKEVPIQDYEGLKPYITPLVEGKENILWPGKPLYFAKTSGTTSGAKYIPISKDSMPYHINAAKFSLLCYINEQKSADFVDGKMIFLQGSPVMDKTNDILTGRLSGIVAHHVPAYLQKNRLPSYDTNCIEDWEKKVDTIVKETSQEDMRLISGIPSWVQMYFEKLIEENSVDTVSELFPNLELFVYGGVNFEPYRAKFESLLGKSIASVELYPASEGFIAFQDSQNEEGMLLYLDGGIFYEFIPADEFFNENPSRISLKDVELDKNYVIILNTNAGLWGYNIGDTIKFTSLAPYRIKVTGRIKHYTSAFGEHVIAEEVESTMTEAIGKFGCAVSEFHVAPQVNPSNGLPYHEWFVHFDSLPGNFSEFSGFIDETLQKKNVYYFDLIEGNILKPCVITTVSKEAFPAYMESQGKLGGQNKVPRLANDRKIAEFLEQFKT